MKRHNTSTRPLRGSGFALALLAPALALGADALPDTDFLIGPTVAVYGPTDVGSQSASQLFTVSNASASTMTLGTLSLAGNDAAEFAIGTDNCSGQSLGAGSECTVEVAFAPSTRGTQSALLLVPETSPATRVLAAFLSNALDQKSEAKWRLPPVVSAMSLPASMSVGVPVTITWSLIGYEEGYTANLVFFDCTGISDGSCGASYSDATRFAESGNLSPVSSSSGEWSYNGTASTQYDFSYTFTPSGFSSATPVVARLYVKGADDATQGLGSLSLLVPGGLAVTYYDTEGRRLSSTINP